MTTAVARANDPGANPEGVESMARMFALYLDEPLTTADLHEFEQKVNGGQLGSDRPVRPGQYQGRPALLSTTRDGVTEEGGAGGLTRIELPPVMPQARKAAQANPEPIPEPVQPATAPVKTSRRKPATMLNKAKK